MLGRDEKQAGMPEGALLAWRAPGKQEVCDPGGSRTNPCPFLPGHPCPVLCTRRGSACTWGSACWIRAGSRGLGDGLCCSLFGRRRSHDFLHVSRDQLMRLQSLIPELGLLSVYSASITFEDKGTLVFYCPIPSIEASLRARRGEGPISL